MTNLFSSDNDSINKYTSNMISEKYQFKDLSEEPIIKYKSVTRETIYEFSIAIGEFLQEEINLNQNINLLESLFKKIISTYNKLSTNQMKLIKQKSP